MKSPHPCTVMALSSSIALILISFFLSIVAGRAVRDLPKHLNISETDRSGGYVKIATIFPGQEMPFWQGECLKDNFCYGFFVNGFLRLYLVANDPKNPVCHDSYEFKVRETTVNSQTYEGSDPLSTHDVDIILSDKINPDLEDYGVSIYLYKRNWREACDLEKESGFDIIKEDEETMETF